MPEVLEMMSFFSKTSIRKISLELPIVKPIALITGGQVEHVSHMTGMIVSFGYLET